MKYIGLLSSAASGKMGGIVASHNRGGQYFRKHSVPTQPRTAAQKLVRNQLQAFSAAFKSLTASQVQGWNALALTVTLKSKLGTTYHPTGQQLFVSCNKHLANVGITTQLSTPPAIPSIPGLTTFTATPVGSGTTVTSWGLATTPNLPANFAVQVRATAVMTGGRTFVGKSAYRNIWGINPAPTQPTNATIFSAYIARFGPLPASGTVNFALRLVDPVSGFAGTPVTVSAAFTQSSAGVSYTLVAGARRAPSPMPPPPSPSPSRLPASRVARLPSRTASAAFPQAAPRTSRPTRSPRAAPRRSILLAPLARLPERRSSP